MRSIVRNSRRGNALLVGLSLGVLLGFSALAVDIGMIRVANTQLQASIDAATFSGATELDGTPSGITKAKARAREVAGLNVVLEDPVDVPVAEVEVGTYDPDTDQFTPWDDDPLTATAVNAVRIDHTPPQIGTALGTVAFGVAGYTINGKSMGVRPAAGPARSTNCFLPIAVPDCHVANTPPGTNPAPFTFQFTNSGTDTVAWGDPDNNPNSNDVRAQLLGQCDHDPIEVGDPIYVNEGSHTTALHAIRDILNDATAVEPGRWDASMYGDIPQRQDGSDVQLAKYENTLEGPVALVDAGADCDNLQFVHSKPMTGIAWAIIFDVKGSGNPKDIKVQLDLINEHEIWGEADDSLEGNVIGTGDPVLHNY